MSSNNSLLPEQLLKKGVCEEKDKGIMHRIIRSSHELVTSLMLFPVMDKPTHRKVTQKHTSQHRQEVADIHRHHSQHPTGSRQYFDHEREVNNSKRPLTVDIRSLQSLSPAAPAAHPW